MKKRAQPQIFVQQHNTGKAFDSLAASERDHDFVFFHLIGHVCADKVDAQPADYIAAHIGHIITIHSLMSPLNPGFPGPWVVPPLPSLSSSTFTE